MADSKKDSSVDPKRLQQFLTINSDLISANKTVRQQTTNAGKDILFLTTAFSTGSITKEKAEELYLLERSIASGNPLINSAEPTELIAYPDTLLIDRINKKTTIKDEKSYYSYKHDIVINYNNTKTVPNKIEKRFFNIEQINELGAIKKFDLARLTDKDYSYKQWGFLRKIEQETDLLGNKIGEPATGVLERIKFLSLSIANVSTDSYTSKSNYAVTIKIAFSNFDDLLIPILSFFKLEDKNSLKSKPQDKYDTVELPLIFFLNKFYEQGLSETSQLQDVDGIILSQKLTLNSERFPKLSQRTLVKNFHLTLHKHSIEPKSFEKDSAVPTHLANVLTLDFVGYELDETSRSTTQPTTPTIGNLYNLVQNTSNLEKAKVSKDDQIKIIRFDDVLKNYQDQADILRYKIRCGQKYKDYVKKQEDLGTKQEEIESRLANSELGKFKDAAADIEKLKTDLSGIREQAKNISTLYHQVLVKVLLSKLTIFQMLPKASLLGTYDANLSTRDFLTSFDWSELANAAIGGATVASIIPVPAVSQGVGALVGGTIDIAYQTKNLLNRVNLVTKALDLSQIKSSTTQADLNISLPTNNPFDVFNQNLELKQQILLEEKRSLQFAQDFTKKYSIDLNWFNPFAYFTSDEKSATTAAESVVGTGAATLGVQGGLLLAGEGIGSAIIGTAALTLVAVPAAIVLGWNLGLYLNEKWEEKQLKDAEADVEKAYKDAFNTKTPTEDENKGDFNVNIYFFTFGDIIKIVQEACQNVKFVVGGKCIPNSFVDAGSTKKKIVSYQYINFSHYPISLDLFTEFLYKKLLQDNKSYKYNAETFLRDVFEQIVKPSITNLDGSANKYLENLSFSNIYLSPSIHISKTSFDTYFNNGAATELVVDEKDGEAPGTGRLRTELFRREFINSQDIVTNGTVAGAEIFKIFSITTFDQDNSYDYFSKYRSEAQLASIAFLNDAENTTDQNIKKLRQAQADKVLNAIDDFTGDEFQKFVTNKSLVPAVLLNNSKVGPTLTVTRSPTFSKVDNPNLYTGQLLNGSSIFKQPYKLSGKFYPHLFHFLNNSALLFVCPPKALYPSQYDTRVFGYHGFYMITSAKFNYDFVKSTLLNTDNSFDIEAVWINYGEGRIETTPISREGATECKQQTANAEPAGGQ